MKEYSSMLNITPAVDFSKLQEVLVLTTTKKNMLEDNNSQDSQNPEEDNQEEASGPQESNGEEGE